MERMNEWMNELNNNMSQDNWLTLNCKHERAHELLMLVMNSYYDAWEIQMPKWK